VRIAVLGWRYVGHPQAGGAELLLHEILRRLAADGHEITYFTAGHKGAPREEEIDGVRVVRHGRQWTVHLHAWRWLRSRLGEVDRVVEHINTIPFLTPAYVPAAKRRFIHHQLARGYWFRQTRGPFRLIAPIGFAMEPLLVALYRRTDGMTISESSRQDLARFGIPARRITVIPLGLTSPVMEELPPKPEGLRLIVLGRLEPAKYVEESIAAFARVAAERTGAVLDVVGGGDPAYRARLERHASRLGVADAVRFHGRVSEDRKLELLREAHVHVFCSHREGWGLTVSEAGAVGTPTAGFDVSGVRDSVADPRLLATKGDTEALARIVLRLAADPALHEELRRGAWERAGRMDYERTARVFARTIGAE
jgi:glycosyltransferase involved in cell wall biosynthesis